VVPRPWARTILHINRPHPSPVAEYEPHKHCRHCGKAVDEDEDYCDKKCKAERIAGLKAQRNRLLYMIVLGAIVILAVTVLPYLGGR